MAKTFNSKTFDPSPLTESAFTSTTDFSGCIPAYNAFPGAADKLEKEFLELKKGLVKALGKFRQSGMG